MMRAGGDKRPVRMGRSTARGGTTQRPRARTPPRGSGEKKSRCGNCGSEKHGTRDCNLPMLAPEKRKCFDCGEEGHEARNCLKKKKKPEREATGKVTGEGAAEGEVPTWSSRATAPTGQWW